MVKRPEVPLCFRRVYLAAGVLRVSSKLGSSHWTLTAHVEAGTPPCRRILYHSRPLEQSASPWLILASEALFHDTLDLTVRRLLSDITPLVVLLLAAGNGYFELYVAVLLVEPQGDKGLAILLSFAGKARDLRPVQQELAVARWELLGIGGILIRRDMGADQK